VHTYQSGIAYLYCKDSEKDIRTDKIYILAKTDDEDHCKVAYMHDGEWVTFKTHVRKGVFEKIYEDKTSDGYREVFKDFIFKKMKELGMLNESNINELLMRNQTAPYHKNLESNYEGLGMDLVQGIVDAVA